MGNSRQILAAALAGGLLGAAGIYLFIGNGAEPDPAGVPLAEDAPAIARGSTSDIDAPSPAGMPRPPAVAQPPTAAMPPNPIEMQAAGLRDAQEASARLEARWAADREDPVTATRIEQRILAAADSEALLEVRSQPLRYEASCRSDLCRLEADFGPGVDANEWPTRMLLVMGNTFESASTVILPSAKGGYQAVVYAFKPGRTPGD